MIGSRRILITGGTGEIGGALVRRLLLDGNAELALVVRDRQKAETAFGTGIRCITVGDPSFGSDIAAFAPTTVFHLAAYSSSADDRQSIRLMVDANILFTADLLAALSASVPELFVYTGSFSEYHYDDHRLSPTYFYSATKSSGRLIADYYRKRDGFSLCNAVLFSIYGNPGEKKKIVDFAADALDAVEPVAMSEGLQELDFVHIDDAVDFFVLLAEAGRNAVPDYRDFFVGTGRGTTIRRLVGMMEEISGTEARVSWGARPPRSLDTVKAVADPLPAKESLGWEAQIALEDGITRYLDARFRGVVE